MKIICLNGLTNFMQTKCAMPSASDFMDCLCYKHAIPLGWKTTNFFIQIN